MIKFNELLEQNKSNNKKTVIQTKKNIDFNVPWVDKYRPKKLSDVVYQHDIVNMLNEVLKTGNLPHLLFYGPPGTGKTSSVLAIAMELFGPKKFNERVIELNASDERGINIVRNKIVTLAKTAVSAPDPNYPCPPYKIIILDEADAMTTEAQSALRKTLEDNSSVTRFCFICNYINQIIEPITSRCVKFRFKPLDEKSMTDKLTFIAQNESLQITNEAVNQISIISNGDMRRAIMLLQNLKYLNKSITITDIYEIANMVLSDSLMKIIDVCIIDKTNDINKVVKLANFFRMSGYPINSIIKQLNLLIVNDKILTDKMKALICIHISNTEKRLLDGADEYLQLLSIFMYIKNVSSNNEIKLLKN